MKMKRKMKLATLSILAVCTLSLTGANEAHAKKTVISSEIVCDGGDAVLVETFERSFLGISLGTGTRETTLGPSSGC